MEPTRIDFYQYLTSNISINIHCLYLYYNLWWLPKMVKVSANVILIIALSMKLNSTVDETLEYSVLKIVSNFTLAVNYNDC